MLSPSNLVVSALSQLSSLLFGVYYIRIVVCSRKQQLFGVFPRKRIDLANLTLTKSCIEAERDVSFSKILRPCAKLRNSNSPGSTTDCFIALAQDYKTVCRD